MTICSTAEKFKNIIIINIIHTGDIPPIVVIYFVSGLCFGLLDIQGQKKKA
jgi:hypothetical protein